MSQRPSKIDYYMGIAKQVAQRATCLRAKHGAIIVRDDQIIATGYVGAPRGCKDSLEHGFCLRTKLGIPHGHRYELCRSVHAEMNAIINAARAGVSLLAGDMYIYSERLPDHKILDALPCFICKKMIINAGLNRVIGITKSGKPKIYNVADWVKFWKTHDIIDDQHQYGDGEKVFSEKELAQEKTKL
ncbi:MAG: dCMP deaminase family protein [Patescibacteria group bacterium]